MRRPCSCNSTHPLDRNVHFTLTLAPPIFAWPVLQLEGPAESGDDQQHQNAADQLRVRGHVSTSACLLDACIGQRVAFFVCSRAARSPSAPPMACPSCSYWVIDTPGGCCVERAATGFALRLDESWSQLVAPAAGWLPLLLAPAHAPADRQPAHLPPSMQARTSICALPTTWF